MKSSGKKVSGIRFSKMGFCKKCGRQDFLDEEGLCTICAKKKIKRVWRRDFGKGLETFYK